MTEGILSFSVSLSYHCNARRSWAVYRVKCTKGSGKIAYISPKHRSLSFGYSDLVPSMFSGDLLFHGSDAIMNRINAKKLDVLAVIVKLPVLPHIMVHFLRAQILHPSIRLLCPQIRDLAAEFPSWATSGREVMKMITLLTAGIIHLVHSQVL